MKEIFQKTSRVYLVGVLFLLAVVGIYPQKSVRKINITWKEFVSQEAGFKAIFPGEPKFSNSVVMTSPIKRTNNRFEVSLEQGYFAVHYSEHPIISKGNDLKTNYDFLENNVAKLLDADIIEQRDIKLDRLLGREVTFKKKDEAVLVRIYVIDSRLYQNIVSISFSDYQSGKLKDEIGKFFDSFTLIEKK